jgi:hypothetical protein
MHLESLFLAEDAPGPAGTRVPKPEKASMARKVLHQSVAVLTGLALMVAMFFGLGLWRRSQDSRWCQQAIAGGAVAGSTAVTSDLLTQVRSACRLQRERQRVMFGAVWRPDGPETAQCGFELARLQLTSYQDAEGYRALLQAYGLGDAFELSSREDQDRFVNSCLATKVPEG